MIYALVDPRTEETRYIGQTRHRLSSRLHQHIAQAESGHVANPKRLWLRELADASEAPVIALLATVESADADRAEQDAIAAHLAQGCRLTNSSHAGRACNLWRTGPRPRHKPFNTKDHFRLEPGGVVAISEEGQRRIDAARASR